MAKSREFYEGVKARDAWSKAMGETVHGDPVPESPDCPYPGPINSQQNMDWMAGYCAAGDLEEIEDAAADPTITFEELGL